MAKKGSHPCRPWTTDEIHMLRLLYPRLGTQGCADALGRKYSSVAAKAWSMGISHVGSMHRWSCDDDATLVRLIEAYAERTGLRDAQVASRISSLYANGVFSDDGNR